MKGTLDRDSRSPFKCGLSIDINYHLSLVFILFLLALTVGLLNEIRIQATHESFSLTLNSNLLRWYWL